MVFPREIVLSTALTHSSQVRVSQRAASDEKQHTNKLLYAPMCPVEPEGGYKAKYLPIRPVLVCIPHIHCLPPIALLLLPLRYYLVITFRCRLPIPIPGDASMFFPLHHTRFHTAA